MLKFFSLKPEVFGLDIDDLSLRIVKLKKSKKGFQLVSFSEVEIEKGIVEDGVIKNPDTLSSFINQTARKVFGKKLGTNFVIASLPEEKSFSQIIQMPFMSEEELKFAVPLEAGNYIPFSLDKVYLDFQIINTTNNTKKVIDVLINVMPKQIVDSYVACIKKAGLSPYVLEVESQAMVRALLNKSDKDPSLIIELKEAKTNLIVYFNKCIRFTSSMQVSSRQITEAISNQLGFSFNEAEKIKVRYGLPGDHQKRYNIMKVTIPILNDFVNNIRKYLDFYEGHLASETSEKKFKKIILCGGGANLKGFSDFLSKKLKIPVVVGDPLVNIESNGNIKFPDKKVLFYTTAIGLALREDT